MLTPPAWSGTSWRYGDRNEPSSSARAAHVGGGRCRRRDGRRRRAGRRAVDDQYRHRRYRRNRPRRWRRWRAPAPRSCASPSIATRRRPPCRTSRSGCSSRASRRRSSATSTISATSSSPIIRPAPRRSTSTASIPAMSASRTRRTASSRAIVETAIKHGKPVRIGANWGSLDQELLTHLMDENSRSNAPQGRARGDARGDDPVGAPLGGSAPRRSACRATASSCRPKSRRCRT